MLRIGNYTTFNDKEYRIARVDSHHELISHNIDDLQSGFTIDDDLYIRKVNKNEVGDVYYINTYVIYQGQKCSLEGEDDEHYFLRIEDKTLAQKLGFEIKDRDDFVKTVLKKDVESVFEEKTPRPNYFK